MIPDFAIDAVVERALAEDLGGGDVTTQAVVEPNARAIGKAVAKSALVVCGGHVFARVFYRVDPGARVEAVHSDGDFVEPGSVLWEAEGSAAGLLMAERVALNFAQRLSGIATLARRYVQAVPAGSETRITDTRKTTPGLRLLERYAVRVGGARNHRHDLSSALLIKDNHIAAARGIRAAVERARERGPHSSRVEVEVRSLAQLDEALAAGADVVLLDNFDREALPEAIGRARGRAVVEISGGVSLDAVPELAALGADAISVGALTHSAPAADIAFDLSLLG